MNVAPPPYQNRYQRSLKRQRLFATLQMISLPVVLLLLAYPTYLVYKSSKEPNFLASKTTPEPIQNGTTSLPDSPVGKSVASELPAPPTVKTASVAEPLSTEPKTVAEAPAPNTEPVIEAATRNTDVVTETPKIDPLGEQLRENSEALKIEIARVEKLLELKKAEVEMLEEKINAANSLLDSEPVVLAATTVTTNEPVTNESLLDEIWLVSLNPEEFVVQIASSTNLTALKDYAQEIQSEEPKAIYPFQATSDGQLVYGASIGVYSSRSLAIEMATALSDKENLNGAWVRQVKEINDQVNNVRKLTKG